MKRFAVLLLGLLAGCEPFPEEKDDNPLTDFLKSPSDSPVESRSSGSASTGRK